MNDIVRLIENADTIAILGHDSEDADSVGSCYAMKLALLRMGKSAECYFSDIPELHLSFMGTNYRVFDENDVPEVDLCLCIDCADKGRIGKRAAIFEKALHTACIDHHETNDGFAEVNLIDADAPAAGEIIYELLKENGSEITREIARNLYTAISADTGSFKYSNVRPRTMQIAAELIACDIDHAEIARYLYDTEPINVMKFKGCLMNGIEQYYGGRLSLVCVPGELLRKFGIAEKDSGDVVNIARSVEGCEIAVSIRDAGEKIKLSFRSNGKFGVSRLAAKFGGGGHAMAAGAAQYGKTLEEVKEAVIAACGEMING